MEMLIMTLLIMITHRTLNVVDVTYMTFLVTEFTLK